MKKIITYIRHQLGIFWLDRLYDLVLNKEFSERRKDHPNPINRKAHINGFSQSEEDSITLEILNRIGLQKGFFVEFGVGNGLENNSIILLALDWQGAWFGGEDLAFQTSTSEKLSFEKVWINRENILDLYSSLDKDADVISIDLDGNDIYLVEELLSNNVKPKLFIVEYNAKIPPQVDFKIDYDASHVWGLDDYFGASLKSFNSLFSNNGYRLVCCNLSGVNAFFVKNDYSENFNDVPVDLSELYSEPFYFLRSKKMHPTSVKTLVNLIS